MFLEKYLLSKLTKKQLKQLAKKCQLTQSGTKEVLISKLIESEAIYKVIKEPFEMLCWHERLFLLALTDEAKRKSEILSSDVIKKFLKEIDGENNKGNYIINRIFRYCKKDLVKGELVCYSQKNRNYSIVPKVQEELSLFSKNKLNILVEDFKKSFLGTYYFSPRKASRTTLLKRKRQIVKYSKKPPLNINTDNKVDRIRILAFSDWRVQNVQDVLLFAKKIGPFDFVMYGGDDVGRFSDVSGQNYFSELARFCRTNRVLAVVGNDDNYSFTKGILNSEGVVDIYDTSVIYGDFAFIGLESSTSGPAIFRHNEEDFKKQLTYHYQKVQGKRLVILSHTPPHGLLDRGIRFASIDETDHHIGSTALREFIETHPVDLVVCGHCHSHGGLSEKCGRTEVVNVSSHDNAGSMGRFAVIELDKDGQVETSWYDTRDVLGEKSIQRIWGIGYSYAEKLKKCGINSIEKLANCSDITKIAYRSDISSKLLNKFQLRAKSMLEDKIIQTQPFGIPNDKLIFIDIETDLKCEKVWLIGLLVDGEFIQLYADNWSEEKDILKRFLEVLEKYPEYLLVSYSGTYFDYRIPLEALRRHGLDTSPLLSHIHLDLYHLVRNCFVFPISRYALKELGAYLGYPFKFSDLNGMMVAIKYLQHVEDGKPLDQKLLKYNEDDVRVIEYIILTLNSLGN